MALATTLPARLGLLFIHRQRHADTELAHGLMSRPHAARIVIDWKRFRALRNVREILCWPRHRFFHRGKGVGRTSSDGRYYAHLFMLEEPKDFPAIVFLIDPRGNKHETYDNRSGDGLRPFEHLRTCRRKSSDRRSGRRYRRSGCEDQSDARTSQPRWSYWRSRRKD